MTDKIERSGDPLKRGCRGMLSEKNACAAIRGMGRKVLKFWWRAMGYKAMYKRIAPTTGTLQPYHITVMEMADRLYTQHPEYLRGRLEGILRQRSDLAEATVEKQEAGLLSEPLPNGAGIWEDMLTYLPDIKIRTRKLKALVRHMDYVILAKEDDLVAVG